jgi:hypothetical protein
VEGGVSTQTRDILEIAISILTVAFSACLYIAAVLYRAHAASRLAALSFLVFGAFAALMLARIFR